MLQNEFHTVISEVQEKMIYIGPILDSLPASYIRLQYIEENEHIKVLNVPGSR